MKDVRSIARFIATARAAAQGAAEAATEEVEYGPPVLLRRNGLLCIVMVERRGDRYVVSKAAWNEAIEAVLWFRREALWYNGLQADAILPYRVHGEALRRFMAWFKNSRLAERAVACCKKFLGASSKGVAYFDRQGVRRHEETDHTNMVTVVLQAYAARKGLVYDRRTE